MSREGGGGTGKEGTGKEGPSSGTGKQEGGRGGIVFHDTSGDRSVFWRARVVLWSGILSPLAKARIESGVESTAEASSSTEREALTLARRIPLFRERLIGWTGLWRTGIGGGWRGRGTSSLSTARTGYHTSDII